MPAVGLAQEPAAQGAEPAAQAPASRAFKTPTPWLRGQSRTRYWQRSTGDDSDNDLAETLTIDFGRAETERVTGHLMGRLAWDIDGRDDTFASINDSYGDRLDALLYDAWADVHRVDGFSLLRFGRQSVVDTPEVAWFDGAHATSAEFGALALQIGAYGGASTRLYESSQSGDLTAGAYAQVRPWSDGRIRVDWMHLEDDRRLGTNEDDVLGAGVWQGFGREVQTSAKYSNVGGKDRDAEARVNWTSAAHGALLQVWYYTLLLAQGDLVLEADPFFQALNALFPYDQWSALAAKDLGKSLRLQAGTDLRRVRDQGDIGFYNRDYDRYHATASAFDFGITGLSLSGTADLWDASAQTVKSWGADASYALGKTTASLGTYYSLYKFDLFSNSERDHVRTYFVRLRHAASDRLSLDGDYELEDDDFDQYHRFRLGVTWRF
ncbi:MAG: hypothetical protein WBO45_24465 [Planctomycetota bacterium]